MKKQEIELLKEALDLLDQVPEDEFILYRFTNKKDKCCAVGHYARLKSLDKGDYTISNCVARYLDSPFRKATSKALDQMGFPGPLFDIAEVNNGRVLIYGHDNTTIKSRVISFLNAAIKLPVTDEN